MKKSITITLAAVALAALTGCKSSSSIKDIAKQALEYQDWRDETKATERAAAEAAAREAVEADAAKAAAKKAAEQAAYKAALAGPHTAPFRDISADLAAYHAAGDQPPVIAPDHAGGLYLMLYKTPAHSLRETVVILGRAWLATYEAGNLAAIDICADPWGRKVIQAGRVVAPYEHKHPAAYFPHLGQHYRPGPVFVIGRDRAGNRLFVYLVPDPGFRTGALR